MKIKDLIIFVSGVAVGSLATWKFVEAKYKRIADEEIESVKEVFSKRYSEMEDSEDDEEYEDEEYEDEEVVEELEEQDKLEIRHYNAMVKKYDTADESNKKPSNNYDEPYVISPDEFGDIDDYETITLHYYEGDGYLTDDNDELVDDADEVIGWDSLNHFGEYEDDAVHVRNDRYKADYEILKCIGNYKDEVKE